MRHHPQQAGGQPMGIEALSAELENRRVVLSQIEDAIKAAGKREHVVEQLRRISEETTFVRQLSGSSYSPQTAASVLNLIRTNSRLYNLASRKLAQLEQGPVRPFHPTIQAHTPPTLPGV